MIKLAQDISVINFDKIVHCPYCDEEMDLPIFDSYEQERRCRCCHKRSMVELQIQDDGRIQVKITPIMGGC